MAPKYRGSSDDWLDNEKAARRQSASDRKKKKNRAEVLPLDQANATVSEVFPQQCRVKSDDGRDALCSYRRANVIGTYRSPDGQEWRERSPVAVGDRVKVTLTGSSDGVVEGVCDRENQLVRPAPGREEGNVHVLAANIDLVCVVAAACKPEFSPGLVDRFLIGAVAGGSSAVICINKIDLFEGESRPWNVYKEIGIPLFEISAKKDQGTNELRQHLLNRKVVFCGHSGVGKTSLLKALTGHDVGRIGDVSESTGKGRHTTTGAVMLEGPENSRWIDTPGVREFGLAGVAPESLLDYFPDLRGLGCEAEECLHLDEEGCRARERPRYESYRRILESLRAGEN